MKTKCLCLLGALASTAMADVNLTLDNMQGWKATATSVYHTPTDPATTVTQTTDYMGGSGYSNFRFSTGPMNTSWQFEWAGISSDAFAGVSLANITSLKIRNFGAFGNNPASWQPPTFVWAVDKGDGSQRCIIWIPWSDGNARDPLVWHEYDAAATGQWLVQETGVKYNSLAALKTALPNAYFEYTAQLPVSYGYASQQAFNVGNCPLYDGDRAFFTGTAGYVDWFEVGVNGVVTRYDLGVVPEPGTLALMLAGLGLFGVLRRK